MSEMASTRTAFLQDALSRTEVDAFGVASVADQAGNRLHDQAVALMPDARSIVVFAMEIYSEVLDLSSPSKVTGEASPRDMMAPHQDYVSGRLTKAAYDLSRLCHRQGFKALPLPGTRYPTDQRHLTSVLSYKHAAEAAGLGTIGWHSLLMTPEFGPRVRLSCVLTDAELKPTPRLAENLCTECNDCLEACPPRAIDRPEKGDTYVLNKYACSVFRSGSGSCVECMRVCPIGR